MQFSWMKKQNKKKNTNSTSTPASFVPPTKNGPKLTGALNYSKRPVQQLNYQTKSQDDWTAPEMAAYGRITGDNRAFDMLNQSTDTRGTKYWNAYRGGRSVLPDGCADFFRDNFGYEGSFDQKFCDDFNALYGNDVRFTRAMGVATPTKKSSTEEWAGYYVTQIQDNLLENNELNRQYGEYRKSLNDYYDQFKKVNGREPTFEEFSNAVDRSKYSKLNAIDESLQYGTKLQVLPSGTFYSPDIIAGLYQAKRNGQDINIDRDYFEDAVQYAMNPVQQAPSMQKYDWSSDDLSQVSVEDRDKYIARLNADGKYKEAADFEYACWAAQPHADGISSDMQPLDARYGSYHDEAWFRNVESDLGSEFGQFLKADGTMDNPGTKAGPLAQSAYYFYKAGKNREKTAAIDNEYSALCSSLQEYRDNNLADYAGGSYEDYRRDVLNRVFDVDVVDWDSDNYKSQESFSTELNEYLKNGYDADKYSCDLHISKAGVEAMIKASWDGEDVTQKKDWAAQADNTFELNRGEDKPSEPPMFYNENQRQAANQRIADRNNAETQITEAVTSLAESGAAVSKGAIPVTNATMDGILSRPQNAVGEYYAENGNNPGGVLAKLWYDAFAPNLKEKLGVDFTPAEAAGADAVLAQLDSENMPDVLTLGDISNVLTAKIMSRINDDDICLADGIINYALPGSKSLHEVLLDKTRDIANTFNPLAYRNVYNDRIDAGYSEKEAASIACFAATTVNDSVESIGALYEGDKNLSKAAQRLVSDIAAEEGSKDTYDLMMAVNDDVRKQAGDSNELIGAAMQKLNAALLLGTSDSATPGFRAETNRLAHDIATGVITPDDIITGLDANPTAPVPSDQAMSDAAAQFLANGGKESETVRVHGVLYTRDEYSNCLGESKSYLDRLGGFYNAAHVFDDMSDQLKNMIGYDSLAEMSGDDPQQLFRAVRAALDDFSNPDKTWHTSALMHNSTNLIEKLNEIGASKTDDQINVNLVNTRQSWMEKNVMKKDMTGSASAVATLIGEEQSVTGDMIDLYGEYGKFLSRNELDATWNAFVTGKATYDEIKALIDERVNSVGGPEIGSKVVNAMNNPQALEKSYTALDEGLERARTFKPAEKPDMSAFAGDPLMTDAAPVNTLSGDPETDALFNGPAPEARKPYSDQELNVMGDFLDTYKTQGPGGYYMAAMDAESLKTYFGIDLDGTEFKGGADVLNAINPDWSTPYGLNPGYQFGMFEAVARGTGEGVRAVAQLPAYMNFFLHDFSYGLVGQEYDPENSNSIYDRVFGLNKQYTEFQKQNQHSSAMQRQVGTGTQAFVEQGISEFVRNYLSSSISAAMGGAYATKMAEKMTGMPGLSMASITAAGEALDLSTTIVNRSLFATSVFANDYNKNRVEDKKSTWNSLIRSTTSAAIELFTESPVYEKFNHTAIGGFARGAEHFAQTAGLSKLSYAAKFAENILSEISEEEASELLGRLVDVGEGVANGYTIEDSWDEAFEGYGEAAKNTAIATAFTTTLFGIADMGGMFADYLDRSMANGSEMNWETAKDFARADAILNAPSIEDIAKGERIAAMDYDKKGKAETTAETKSETSETTSHDFNPATNIPRFGKNGEAANAELTDAVKNYLREATQAPVGNDTEATSETKPSETESATQKVSDAVQNMMDSLSEDRAEAAQEAQEAASEQTEENPQEQTETSREAAPALPEGAQRVKDYVDHAETAMDNAIIDKGATIAAEQAIAEDAGLKSREQAIEKMQGKIQENEEKIAGLQQQSQTITNQLQQAFYAVADEGFDMNSPQAMNVQYQKTQQKAAVDADAAELSEKTDSMTREMEEAQQQLEDEKQQIVKKTREQKLSEYKKKIESYKKEKLQKKLKEQTAKDVLFDRGKSFATIMDEDDERELNANLARKGGYNVNSMATTKEDVSNRGAIFSEQDFATDVYETQIDMGAGMAATEAYTDPANYRRKSNYTERRSEEWRDESKHRQDAINDNIADERRQRMINSFMDWREDNAPEQWIQVDPRIYYMVAKEASKEADTTEGNTRYTKYVSAKGDSAITYSQARVSRNGRKYSTVTRDDRGYSENPEDIGVYSAADFLNDDGTVTGLAYRAIVAADPDFVDNAGILRVNRSNGGVDAVLEHFSENNRWLLLATPYQEREYGKSSLEEDKYHMLTKDNGLNYLRNERENAQKLVDSYTERMRQAHEELEPLKSALNDPTDYNPTETAQKFREATEKLTRATNGYKAAQKELANADQRYVDAEAFVRDYKATTQKKGKTIYAIDKAAIEDAKTPSEIYNDAVIRTADRVAENAFLSDEGIIELLKHDTANGNSDAEEYVESRLGRMNHEELGAALFDHFLQEELQKGYAEQYSRAVQVLRGTNNMTADKQAANFIKNNGGFANDGFGGQGFSEFTKPDYYDKSKAYMVSEEAVLKFVPENMWKDLIVEANGKRRSFDKTTAQYNVSTRRYARQFAEAYGLSNTDAAFLSDTFGVRNQAVRSAGNATIVSENDELYFGVPTKNIDDYTRNTYIRDEGGSLDLDKALQCLEDKMRAMVQTSEDEANGIPGKKLNTIQDYIGVWFTNDSGSIHKNVKIGEYYNWWNGGSRFFPSYEQLLGMADKIVCNFPAVYGKNQSNEDSLVSFTIIPKTGDQIDLEREMNTSYIEDVEGELASRRGRTDAEKELNKIVENLRTITNDPNVRISGNLAAINAMFDTTKIDLREAVEKAETCTDDTKSYWKHRAVRLYSRLDKLGNQIRNINEKAGSVSRVDETKEAVKQYQELNKEKKPTIPKTAEGRYLKAKARYDLLTDPNSAYYSDPNYDHEREMFAAVLPDLKRFADEEKAAVQSSAQEQPISPANPDPEGREIAEGVMAEINDNPTVKLAILKNLSDNGADIADLRTQAVQEFHDKQMEGMSDDEKLDYVAALAQEKKMNPDGYTIDPNADYEAQLHELLKAKDEKAKNKDTKRLKAISRASYKTPRGANKALAELDDLEKKGYDVSEARERIKKNLGAISNPNQEKIDAVVDSVEDPDLKLNLQLFSNNDTGTAIDEASETVDNVAKEILDAMRAPREIVTGFENTVQDLSSADSHIMNEDDLRYYEEAVAGAETVSRDLTEEIDSRVSTIQKLKDRRDAVMKEMTDLRKQYVTPENNALLDRLYNDLGNVYKEGPVSTAPPARHSMELQIDLALGDDANTWSTEQRDKYNQLYAQYTMLGREIRSKVEAKDKVVDDRDKIGKNVEPYKNILLNSTIAHSIVNNRSKFGPGSLEGSGLTVENVHRQRRQQYNENANGIIKEAGVNDIFGKSTILTREQVAELYGTVIDEKQLAQDQAIADALGRQVKELKVKSALLELMKVAATGDKAKYDTAFEKTFDTIMELYPQTEFTSAGKAKYKRTEDRVRRRINEQINTLMSEYNVANDGDALYKVLDQQKLAIDSAIQRAEETAKNYYSLGAKGLNDAFSGNSGGHLPASVILTNFAILRKSMKGHNPAAIGSNVIDTFPRICEKLMGKNAKLFISQYIAPVREGEAQSNRRFAELRNQYKWLEKVDKDTRHEITKARHFGWSEKYIRDTYKDKADTILRGVETYRSIFDSILPEINVAYKRNGIDPVKKHSNYVPLIPMEKNKVLRAMGIHASFEDVPTAVFGETEGFRPIHEFFRFAMERKNDYLDGCELDPLVLFDTYLPSALTQIYQTDNIVRMRDMIECINENVDYGDLGEKTVGALQNFRRYFTEYCNTVSGKKVGFLDRAMERTFTRKYFSWAKALTQIKGQSATGANLNVLAANFEPVTMCMGTNPVQTARAWADTIHGLVTGTSKDLVSKSDFLTTRFSDKGRAYTPYQKLVQGMYKGAELTDRLCAEVVWRVGYYNSCERLGIDPAGDTVFHKQARMNADNYAIKVMASKARGEKAMMYNSSTGSIIGQFLQENINNLRFMRKDASTYAGGNESSIGHFSGTVKAMVAILMALAGHELINQITGRDVLFSLYGIGKKTLDSREENESPAETIMKLGQNTLTGLNPFENIMENNSKIPVIGGIPLVSSVEQTWNNIVTTAERGINAVDSAINGTEHSKNDTDWITPLANAILNWAPGGTAIKRGFDTAKVATQGYAISTKGRFKYPFEPTAGNIALSAMFGPDSSIEGRRYTASGYATQSDNNTAKILSMIDAGVSPSDAYNAFAESQNVTDTSAVVTTANRRGGASEDQLAEAREARELQGIPNDLSSTVYGDITQDWLKKGLDWYKEYGYITYPTSFKASGEESEGKYFKDGGKDYPVDNEILDAMNTRLAEECKYILEHTDDPEEARDSIKKMKERIKKEMLKGITPIGGE